MAEENVVMNLSAHADFSNLVANVNKVSASLVKMQQQVGTSNRIVAGQIAAINKAFSDTLKNTGQFNTHFVTLSDDVAKFGNSLDKGQLKLRDYYSAWQQHNKTSGGLVRDLARQQVQLQNAILQPLGKNAQGLQQFNVQVASGLDLVKHKGAIATEELKIMNRVMQQGADGLINWGKNTQWAGRQLTVGLTVPIAAFGMAAAKAFREADAELVRLTKVYGGVAAVSTAELKKIRNEVSATATELSKAYGTSFKETIGLAADLAATGKQGNDLLKATAETTRLMVLGEVDRQDAMKTTLTIQNTFNQSTKELAESIDFLNAVENQTSLTIQDLTEAIPKAGPVVKALGGDVKDLALYLTAMKEGGINASEGANAIKSALASLINPTKVSTELFESFGINLRGIVENNRGDVTQMLLSLQSALDGLDPLSKSRAIEQLFGKFQFARISALIDNLGKSGSQSLQVLDLLKKSTSEIGALADRELKQVTESASGKYNRAVEGLRADLAGIGDEFLKVATFFINITDKVVNFVNKLPGPIKSILTFLAGLTAVSGPLIMLAGVMANFIGYVIKGAFHLKALFKSGEGWRMLTPEILAAQKAGSLVEKTFYSDAQAALALAEALAVLNSGYTTLNANINKGVVSVQPQIQTLAGSVVIPGGQGARFVDPRNPLVGEKGTRASAHTNPLAGRTAEQIAQSTIYGFTPAAIPVNNAIKDAPQMYSNGDLPSVPGLTTAMSKKHGEVSVGIVAQEATKWHTLMGTLSMMSKTEVATMKKEIHATGAVSSDFMAAYSSLLPEITKISEDAVTKSAAIVSQVKSGEMSIAAAKEKLIQLNYQIEAAMGTATTGVATSLGRTANLTTVPTLDQPVVDPTGKSNMRQIFGKKNAAWMDKLASAMGVKTWGASYSTHTTIPKRLNAGGAVYDPARDGNVVPGDTSINYDNTPAVLREGGFVLNQDASRKNPDLVGLARNGYNSGGRVVDALLTPGETYFPPEMAQSMMPVLEKANSGSRISLRNAGGILGGLVNGGRYGYGKSSIFAAFERETKKAAKGRSRDAILNPLGISVRGQRVESFVSQIGEISDQALRQKYLTITKQFAKKIKTEPGDDPRFFNRRKKETLAAKNIEDLNDLYTRWGLPPLPSKQDWHGTHWTVSDLLGKGRSLISDYIVNYSAKSNLAANQNKLTAEGLFRRDLVVRPGINKYEKQLKAAGIPKDQWDSAELNIDESIRSFFLKEARDKSLSLDQIFIGDRPGKAGYTFTQHFIPLLEKELKKIDPYSVYKPSYQKLKTNRKVRQTLNMGGMVGGKVKTGKYGYGYKPPQWAIAGNTGKNKFKGEYKSPLHLTPEYEDYISKTQADYWDKLPKDESGRYWYTPEQLRLQREGKARAFTYPQPKRFYQDLSNDNPLHGALQIGAYQAPMHVRNQYVGAQLRYRMPVGKNWRDEGFTKPAPVLGSVEDRAKSALFRYMQGDYQAIGSKEVQDYLSTIRTKFTGTLHRGVNWRTSDSLPPFIKKMIEEKRWSDLVGQEFIMRRSSWSKNPKTAQGFGLGIEGKGYNQVVLTADVKNRNAVPASEIFPDLTFQTAKGPVAVNESEVYMGGKFKIVSAANGKIKLQAVYDQQVDGKREHGGPVNAGRPYLVGEKGPELFVPKNAGGIVSNYALGGMVRSNKTGYGKMNPVAKYVGQQALMMAGFQMLMPMLSKMGLPKVVTDNAFNAMFMGQIAHGAYKTNKAVKAQKAAQAGAAIGDTAVAAEGAEKAVARFSPRLLALGSVAARAAGPIGVLVTALQVYQMISSNRKHNQEVLATSFGLTAKTAKEAGVQVRDLNSILKESEAQAKSGSTRAALSFANDNANVKGINLTVKQLSDLEKKVKKTMPSYVEAFKKMTGPEIASGATNIKAQWVAMGMNVQEANAKIYSLIKLTHGQSTALSTMNNKAFQSITDKASAAKESINMLAYAIKHINNLGKEGVANSFNTFLQTQTARFEDLVNKPKDKDTKTPYADAYSTLMEQYKNKGLGGLKLPEGMITELGKTDPLLASMLNKSDTIASAMSKWVIATAGTIDNLEIIGNLSDKDANKLAAGMLVIQDSVSKGLSADKLTGAKQKEIKNLQDALLKSQNASAGMAVKDQIASKKKIKSLEDEIKKINEAAAARKKAMEQQQVNEDVITAIKKKQLEYQQALASGDMTAAAQAQLDIQMMSSNRQTDIAKNSIDVSAAAQIKPLQDQIDKLNDSLNNSADAQALAADSMSKASSKLSDLISKDNALKTALDKAMTDSILTKTTAKEWKEDLRNLVDAYGELNGLAKKNGKWVGTDGKPIDEQALFDRLKSLAVASMTVAAQNVVIEASQITTGNGLGSGVYKGSGGSGSSGPDQAKSDAIKGKTGQTPVTTPSTKITQFYQNPDPAYKKPYTMVNPSGLAANQYRRNGVDTQGNNIVFLANGQVKNLATDKQVGWWYGDWGTRPGKFTFDPSKTTGFNQGGSVRNYEEGSTGGVRGPGTGTSDSIPAMLSNGEYVIKADSVKKYGIGTFDALNAQKLHTGGPVGHKHLASGHASSQYDSRSNWNKAGHFLSEIVKETGRSLDWFTSWMAAADSGEFKSFSQDNQVLANDAIAAYKAGYKSDALKVIGVKTGLSGLNVGLTAASGGVGSAAGRTLIEAYGISKGIPALGTLLPKGAIPYATAGLAKTTQNAVAAAIIGGSKPFLENKIAPTIEKPKIKISAEQFKPNDVYPPWVFHEGAKVPVHSGGPFGNDAVVFQGVNENLSSLLTNHQVSTIIPTRPEGILEYILKKDPSNQKAKRLLEKFNSGYKDGDPEVKEFLMNMFASGHIKQKKEILASGRTSLVNPGVLDLEETVGSDGLVQVISAMLGNTKDLIAIKSKTKAISPLLSRMVEEYQKSINLQKIEIQAEIERKGGLRGGLFGYRGDAPLTKAEIALAKAQGRDPHYIPPTPKDIAMVRIFNNGFPSRDGNGDLFEKAAGSHIFDRYVGPRGSVAGTEEAADYAISRTTRHFGIYDGVQNHNQGTWQPDKPFIVSTLSNLMNYNGKPEAFHSVDTWFAQKWGKPFHYSKKEGELAEGHSYTENEYIAKLKKLGLYEEGKPLPIISEDPINKEVFYLAREKYSEKEINQILEEVNSNENLLPMTRVTKEMLSAPGGERKYGTNEFTISNYGEEMHHSAARALQVAAFDRAKRLIGINEKFQYADNVGHSSLNEEEIMIMAQKLGVKFTSQHNGSDIDNLSQALHGNPLTSILNPYKISGGSPVEGISNKESALSALLMHTRFGKYQSGKVHPDKNDLDKLLEHIISSQVRKMPTVQERVAAGSNVGPDQVFQKQLDEWRELKKKQLYGFADGGYVGNGIKIPKFDNGINMVPADMLAMIHKNEAVIPANMNPFNPNASNATMGNTIYLTNNITAAPGMDTELLARRVTDMTKQSLSAEMNISASKVGINNQFGSKVMN